MRAPLCGLLCLLPILAGCASLPGPREAAGTRAAWPALMPIDTVLAAVPPPAPDPAAAVAARAAALRARAAALQAPAD